MDPPRLPGRLRRTLATRDPSSGLKTGLVVLLGIVAVAAAAQFGRGPDLSHVNVAVPVGQRAGQLPRDRREGRGRRRSAATGASTTCQRRIGREHRAPRRGQGDVRRPVRPRPGRAAVAGVASVQADRAAAVRRSVRRARPRRGPDAQRGGPARHAGRHRPGRQRHRARRAAGDGAARRARHQGRRPIRCTSSSRCSSAASSTSARW